MRRFAIGVLISNILLLPLSLVPILILGNSVNPMQLTFITEFTVENATDGDILVTPIGTVGKEGMRHPLPMARMKVPWSPSSQRGRFRITPGENRVLMYDWDDINFSEIVVETDDGRTGQLVVNPDPTERQYHPPQQTVFTVHSLEALDPLDTPVWEACLEARTPFAWRRLFWLGIPALTILPVFFWFRRQNRPSGQTGDHS